MARFDLRPSCELCDKDLLPQSDEARICTYECTYCADCAETVLQNVCINCGGNLVPRPIRPMISWRPEEKLGLVNHPASQRRVLTTHSKEDITAHVACIKGIPPQER